MDDFLRTVTTDFELIAKGTGFRFNQYSGLVDWENLEGFSIDDIVEKADVKSLSMLVASVLSYNIEKMSASKKIFRLSQLIIDFLLHCKKHSTFKLNEKVDSIALCELCGKMFMDVGYLKYHCFRRHKLNSCIYTNLPGDNHVESLKSEIVQLQTQLEEMKSTYENKLPNTKIHLEESKLNKCYAIHKNKLMYHLIPQLGDNPMQIQEMYWKQKYDKLEEDYNTLKSEYEKKQNIAKTTTVLLHKHQQCDLNKIEKSSKCVQTNSIIEDRSSLCSPKQLITKYDMHKNINNKLCNMDIPEVDQTNSDYRLNGDGSSDRDFCELKKLRLEARMNITENNICEDYSDPLLSCEYVDSIKIVLALGETRVNELIKNGPLMDLIKFDVKELVNKRLEECYRFTGDHFKQDNVLHEMGLYENRETCEVSICEDLKIDQHSPKIDCDKTSIKKNKTVLSKLKKKALRLSKVFSPDSKNN